MTEKIDIISSNDFFFNESIQQEQQEPKKDTCLWIVVFFIFSSLWILFPLCMFFVFSYIQIDGISVLNIVGTWNYIAVRSVDGGDIIDSTKSIVGMYGFSNNFYQHTQASRINYYYPRMIGITDPIMYGNTGYLIQTTFLWNVQDALYLFNNTIFVNNTKVIHSQNNHTFFGSFNSNITINSQYKTNFYIRNKIVASINSNCATFKRSISLEGVPLILDKESRVMFTLNSSMLNFDDIKIDQIVKKNKIKFSIRSAGLISLIQSEKNKLKLKLKSIDTQSIIAILLNEIKQLKKEIELIKKDLRKPPI